MQQNEACFKATETLNKQQQLLTAGKFYEYSQKVKLLSNRKLQTKKTEQALYLLSSAAHKLLHHNEINEAYELIAKWISVLEEQPELYNENLEKIILELYEMKEFDRKAEELERLLKKFGKGIHNKDKFCALLGHEFTRKGKFSQAEKYVVRLGLKQGLDFLRQWGQKITADEASIVSSRFALTKLVQNNRKDCQQVLNSMSSNDGFKAFSQLLLRCIECKSKQGFFKIGKSFEYLLKNQASLTRVYDEIGLLYFAVQRSQEKKQGGLLGGIIKD